MMSWFSNGQRFPAEETADRKKCRISKTTVFNVQKPVADFL